MFNDGQCDSRGPMTLLLMPPSLMLVPSDGNQSKASKESQFGQLLKHSVMLQGRGGKCNTQLRYQWCNLHLGQLSRMWTIGGMCHRMLRILKMYLWRLSTLRCMWTMIQIMSVTCQHWTLAVAT